MGRETGARGTFIAQTSGADLLYGTTQDTMGQAAAGRRARVTVLLAWSLR